LPLQTQDEEAIVDTKYNQSCPFCQIARHELSAEVIQEDEEALALMDLYPATVGHVLVIPKRHIENIYVLPSDLGAHLMAVAVEIARAVKQSLAPNGLTLVQSNEFAGGQTIPHFHLHIVPRYRNDLVVVRFGHGDVAATKGALQATACRVRSALRAR
jgi:histidine triad (HIT) family protein